MQYLVFVPTKCLSVFFGLFVQIVGLKSSYKHILKQVSAFFFPSYFALFFINLVKVMSYAFSMLIKNIGDTYTLKKCTWRKKNTVNDCGKQSKNN